MIRSQNSDNMEVGSKITNVSMSGVLGAMKRSSYNPNDCVNMVENTISGSRLFTKFGRDIDKKLEDWKYMYATKNNNPLMTSTVTYH